jgi:hypothetical protein
MTIQLVVSMMMLAVLSACSSNPEQGKSSGALNNLPTWAISPTSEAGLADSACVQFSGSINIDRSEAITLASEQLAAQLEKKVSFLAKSFQSKTKTTDGLNVGSSFSQTGQQLVQNTLNGAKATQMGVYKVAEVEQLCVLVEMNEAKTKAFYNDMKQTSNATLDAKDDDVVYEEFRAYKADLELQKAQK